MNPESTAILDRARLIAPDLFSGPDSQESERFDSMVLGVFIPAWVRMQCNDLENVLSPGVLGASHRELFPAAIQLLAVELRLSQVAGHLKGDTSRERYLSYISAFQTPWFQEHIDRKYPVFRTLVQAVVDNAVANERRSRDRFASDTAALATFLGSENDERIIDLTPLGDSHNGGLRSTRFHLESGKSVILKHRAAGGDTLIEDLLELVNLEGIVGVPPRLDRGDYHWQKWIESNESPDESRIAAALGSWLAVAYFSATVDLHIENMVAFEGVLYAVDLECVAHGQRASVLNGRKSTWGELESTSILPMRVGATEDFPGFNWGAFGAMPGGNTGGGAFLTVIDDETDQLSVEFISNLGATNSAEGGDGDGDGERIVATNTQAFADNFGNVARRIAANAPKWLAAISSSTSTSRHVLKATQVYADAWLKSSHPAGLIDMGRHRRAITDSLSSNCPPELEGLLPSEVESVLARSIPLYLESPDGTGILGHTGLDLISGLEIATRRVQSELTDEGIGHHTRGIIRVSAAYAGPESWAEREPKSQLPSSAARESSLAQKIADRIIAEALPGNEIGWITVSKWLGGGWLASRGLQSMYGGYQGIAVAIAAAERTGQVEVPDSFRIQLMDSLRLCVDDSEGAPGTVGAYEGSSGLQFTVASLSKAGWLSKTDAITLIGRLDRVIRERLPDDTAFDLLSGSAGVLAVYPELVAHGYLPSTDAAQTCDAALLHLESASFDTGSGLGWAWNAEGDWMGGLSHGVAGIAFAAARAQLLVGNTALARRIATEAWRSQMSLLDVDTMTWSDRRPTELLGASTLNAWCHGQDGISLAWDEMSKLLPEQRDLMMAHLTSMGARTQEAWDSMESSVCHGIAGNLVIAHELGTRTPVRDLWDSLCARERASVDADHDEFTWMDLSLMCGKSGVLWAHAYFEDSAKIANPLTLRL